MIGLDKDIPGWEKIGNRFGQRCIGLRKDG